MNVEHVGYVLFSGKICMPDMSFAKIHKEKTLLEKCLESKLDEDMNLRKQCTKKQTECVTRDLWALFE